MNNDHIPAPAEHAPKKETLTDGITGIVIREVGSETAFIGSDYSVSVER